MKKYAGIGSRETPHDILKRMKEIAGFLSKNGYLLRSGGALGADRAFEAGSDRSEIFYANDATPEAIELSSKYHPNWGACSDYARKLHGRNAMILLGQNLDDPVDFVVCWTKDGKASGGTGQAMRIAMHRNIPIFNLKNADLELRYDDDNQAVLFS